MATGTDWACVLAAADADGRLDLLRRHSGLPGPRANLALARAWAEQADPELAAALVVGLPDGVLGGVPGGDDEYLALCGATALGRRAESVDPAALRAAATDPRWRVREGVATGMQVLGAESPDALLDVLKRWRNDPHPLVQRARAAAICEPPLLRAPRLAAVALTVCEQATDALLRVPPPRRAPDARTLRQALGSCWSVAIAASPGAGLPRFAALAALDDPDVAWIVRTNRTKAPLARLLPTADADATA